MPRKGMRSLCFTYKPQSSSSSTRDVCSSSSTSSNPHSESTIQRSIAIAELMITKWNPDTSGYAKVTSLFYESKKEAMEFIKCVNNLQKCMHLLLSENSHSSETLIRAQSLMQIAMKRLQKEFYQILSTNRAHLDPESVSTRSSITSARSSISDFYGDSGTEDEIHAAGDSISEMEQVSFLAMENLRCIAECMISSGYGKECIKIYTIIRKSIIDEGVYKLGMEKISLHQFNKLNWELQEMRIINWLDALKIAIKTLFSGERILCDHVFGASENMRESCFTEISKEGANLLFGFPEIVAKSKKSPDKMFRTLDMYTAIVNHWPEIESIFSFESTSLIRSQALNSMAKLGESTRTMLSEFESVVQKDSSKTPAPGGGIHKLTNYAMNYLSLLADHGGVLSDILADYPPTKKSHLPESYESDDSPAPSMSVHVAWLILVLLCKLDSKSKHYKNVSLSYLFLANNLHHIVSKVRTSNLKYILGEDWISKHELKVRQFASSYERLGWSHVYSSLPEESEMSPEEAKELFKMFNSSFEEAYKKQSVCIVPDSKLRDEIKVSIAEKIIPKYREFYERHKLSVGGRGERLAVRFDPEDVGHYLSDLFFGGRDLECTTSISTSSSINPDVGISLRFEPMD